MKHRLHRPASAAALAAAVLGLSGCAIFSPPTVLRPYNPGDGVRTTVGDVEVRNALVVAADIDRPGVVSVLLVNVADEENTVTVSASGASGTFTVAPGQNLQLGAPSAPDDADDEGLDTGAAPVGSGQLPPPEPASLVLPQVSQFPGETIPVSFTVGSETLEVDAPIVLPCFEYATITPTADPADPSATTAEDVECGPALGEEGLLTDEDIAEEEADG
ncbi:hypothetical protein [Kineococcus sp. SYSU DK004]|uniref:hypothetical protein n=1 Tax=Kineococcus sp. SYSU DK004 TaxID=3383125 RepID=UPI003D7CEB07